MEPFPMEIAFNSRCAFRSIDFFPAFNSVYLPWFAFKLDHLCLLHLIRTMIQSQLYRVKAFGFVCSSFLLIYIVCASLFYFIECVAFLKCLWFCCCWMEKKADGFAVFLIISIWRSLHSHGTIRFCQFFSSLFHTLHLIVCIAIIGTFPTNSTNQ